jgi:UDP-glucuronate decarboxylase
VTIASPTGVSAAAAGVVDEDIDYCCARLSDALAKMSGRAVLLTGGAGFVGYYLIQVLLGWNRRVKPGDRIQLTVADNYVRGVPPWMAEVAGESLRVALHDVTTPLPDQLGDFHYVLHAASIASPSVYRRYPILTMDANVAGVRLLLERSRQQRDRGHAIEGFLFFSSSEIYGDPEPDAIPTPESYPGRVSSTGPRACYDESKRFGETLCVNFAQQYELPVTIVRPFNNYGPGLRITDQRVIPDLARDIFEDRDMVLYSDGSATRTFCYIADAVTGYVKALVQGRRGEAYNIGCDSPEISIDELASRVSAIAADTLGYSGRVIRRRSADDHYLTDNPRRRCPDIRKARRELGFSPDIHLDEGLRRSLLWYLHNREHSDT